MILWYIPSCGTNVSTGSDVAIHFLLLELFRATGFSCDFANPAASQGNMIWVNVEEEGEVVNTETYNT